MHSPFTFAIHANNVHPSPRVAYPHRDQQSRSCRCYPLRSHRGFCWTAEVLALLTTRGKAFSLTTLLGTHYHPLQSGTTEAPQLLLELPLSMAQFWLKMPNQGRFSSRAEVWGQIRTRENIINYSPYANKAHLSTRYPYGRMTNSIKMNLGEYYLDTQLQSRKKSESRKPLTWFHIS